MISNEIYLKNMRALWRVDPQLAWQIDEYGEPKRVVLEASRNGPVTACVPDDQGRKVYLHSRYDPVGEAKRLVDSLDSAESACYVLNGLGLGYHLLALFDKTDGDAFLIVGEPDFDMLAAAFFSVDLSRVIEGERCIFMTQVQKNYMHKRLELCNTTMMLGTQFVTHPPSERLQGEFHQALRASLRDYIAYSRMTIMTLVANARITCKNIANNLPTYLSTPPIDILRQRFAGKPAVVISAGPSLRKNIDQLAGLQDRAVLIAVQTMLKPLLGRGIKPHFVTSLDFHEVSRNFFEGVDSKDLADIHLVAEPKATWHVIDVYKGMISLLDNSFARMCVGDALASRDGLVAGATVAHLSYYLAEYLGCDPIIFVGQDLAYTDHLFYTPGVAVYETWRPDLNRFCSIEMKDWEHIVRRRNILRKVKDVHGHEIYTDDTLFTYLEQFEKDFAGARARVIDATEGGAYKRGTTVMTLAEAARQFCPERLPESCFAYRRQAAWWNDSRLKPAVRELNRRVEDVTYFRDRSKECVDVLKEMMQLTDKPAEFNRKLARVDDLRAQIGRHEATYQLVNQMAPLAELRRYSADRKMDSGSARGEEKARRQLFRDIEFVSSMIEAADIALEILREAIERTEKTIAAGGPIGPQGGTA